MLLSMGESTSCMMGEVIEVHNNNYCLYVEVSVMCCGGDIWTSKRCLLLGRV